jgi:AcrR family transcriptional regulator
MSSCTRTPSKVTGHQAVDSGSNGLGREQRDGRGRVSEIQRARMLRAMVGEAAGRGAGNVTVAHVVARSGVSRRTFYEIFEDREDCFLQAFDDGVRTIAREVVFAYEAQAGWRERMRAGLLALLTCLEDETAVGRLVIVEALGGGPRALERRQLVLDALVRAIDGGRAQARAGREPPVLTADGIVGAVLSILHARLLEEEPAGFLDLLNPLMGMIVLPYLGRAAADRELGKPTPARQPHTTKHPPDPLRDLEMRLTYRTVRVLLAVAANPGSSNRTVADASDIGDQGQISKLLARLHGLGLIENNGAGPARGEPNAWTLTAKGWRVHAAIAQQTTSA